MLKKFVESKNINVITFFNILGPIILNGVNFLTLPLFTRLLGAENFGQVSLYLTWVQIFSIFVGLETSGTISMAKVYVSKDKISDYFSSAMFLSLSFFLMFSFFVVLFEEPLLQLTTLPRNVLFLALLHSFGKFIISFVILKCSFFKEAFKTFLLSVSVALAELTLSVIFIVNIEDFELRSSGRIFAMASVNVVVGTILFLIIASKSKRLISFEHIKFCLPLCLPLIFHRLSHFILSQSDCVMLQHFSGETAVGLYSFVSSTTQIINIIGTALNYTWSTFYIDDMKEKNYFEVKSKTYNYIYLFTSLCVGFMFIFPEIIKAFSGPEFWEVTDLVPIMVISSFLVALYILPSNFEDFYKKTIYTAIGTTLAALLNIALNFLLIPRFEMLGAAVATALSYFTLFIFHEIISTYFIKYDYPKNNKWYLCSLAIVFLCSLIFYFIKNLALLRIFISSLSFIFMIRKILKNKTIF